MADINLGQLTEAINDKADRDINNLSISGFDATKTQVIKNDNGVIKWAAESGGGGSGGSYTAGEGIKIEDGTISFDGTTIPGYSEEEGPGYLKYYHGDGYTFIGFGPEPSVSVGAGTGIKIPEGGNTITLDLGQYEHTSPDLTQAQNNGRILKYASFPGYFGDRITLGASGTSISPNDSGWYAIWVEQNPDNKDLYIRVELRDAGDSPLIYFRSDGKFPSVYIPKQKEQQLVVYHNFDSTISYEATHTPPRVYYA